jgi:metal-dependent amidase/aminoacylase/carboxypeptidase family protein
VAELDALPVAEKTGLTYASHVTIKNEQGNAVSIMHACGHDLHLSIERSLCTGIEAETAAVLELLGRP